MVEERVRKIAALLVDYSAEVKEGDRVLIRTDFSAKDLALEVYRYALLRGANPWIRPELPGSSYIFYKYATDAQLGFFPEHEMTEIKNTDAYFHLRAPPNVKELSSIDPGRIGARLKTLKPIQDWRVEKTRWVIFYYPTDALAQEAEMSLQEFEDFVFSACLIDWEGMSKRLRSLKEALDDTDKVRIVSQDTSLGFSVKGRNAVVGDGKRNMPDGELFTSVLEESVNGHIRFDIPAVMHGNIVEDIILTFEQGRVVDAKAVKNQPFLEKIMATDEGAKRIGELGIGLNYDIARPVKNILFDEKIGGTIHLALGMGYKENLSKNESAIHLDLIKDMRKGGEIYFDEKRVMKDGEWLILKA